MVVVWACGARLGLRLVFEAEPLNVNLSSLESWLRASSGQACKKRFRFNVGGVLKVKLIKQNLKFNDF